MSDVSKTNGLIAESRKFLFSDSRYGYEDTVEGDLICRLADALEAATRVPVQGEPNDDRTPEFEAIEQELFKHQPVLSMQDGSIRGCKCMDRVFLTKTEDWGTHLAEVFEQLSRATVPDAAVAAIERARAIHQPTMPGYGPKACVHDGRAWPCPTVVALDGAPEPECEYGTAMHMPVAWKGGSHCTSEESREAAELRVASAKVPAWLTRRRKAGPWLLVEGESKP